MRCWVFLLFQVVAGHCVFAQDSIPVHWGYTVDGSLKKTIEKKKLDKSVGSLTIQWLENGEEATIPLSGKDMPCYAVYSMKNDTIQLFLMPSFTPGVGILIFMHKDSTWATHIVSSKDQSLRSFKANITDKEYQHNAMAPAKSYKLILTKTPSPNEPIEGYIEFESVEFYQKWDTADLRRGYNAKGYFSASPQ